MSADTRDRRDEPTLRTSLEDLAQATAAGAERANPANQLFSHPETHDPVATSSSSEPEQPSWTNLFQEPVPTQRASSER